MKGKGRGRIARFLGFLPLPLSLIGLYLFTPAYRATLLLAALLAHEGGHLAAFACLSDSSPGFLPVGGGFRFLARSPLSYRSEGLIALAGPAVNLFGGALFLLLGGGNPYAVEGGIVWLGTGLSNLLPVCELDGGRLLACILSAKLGPARAGAILVPLSLLTLGLSLTLSLSLLWCHGAGICFTVFCLVNLVSQPLPSEQLF